MEEQEWVDDEAALMELLRLVRGEIIPFMKSIMTYTEWPGADSGNQQLLHDGLLQLEARGLVKRVKEKPGMVLWEAT